MQLAVVGGGPAGCAAALEAARAGLAVTLIDEHPQATAIMGLDTPYFYGTRLPPALASARATAERVLEANTGWLECLEAGVEVLTGTCAWGLFVPGVNNRSLPSKCLGLADASRSWVAEVDQLVLAPGARDLVLSFPGWQLPGVLGVQAASVLLRSYQALGGSRVLVLGSGNVALAFARQALAAGIEVAGLVEPTESMRGDARLAAELEHRGVAIHRGYTIERALGNAEVSGARLVPCSPDRRGEAVQIACDTICLAFGTVPNIELAAVAGCRMAYDARLGGWVPELDAGMQSSVAGLYVVGDGAGVTEASALSPDAAVAQARVAVQAATSAEAEPHATETRQAGSSALYPPTEWLEALLATGGPDVQLCQCEEVSRREFLAVQPPRYLGVEAWRPKGLSAVDAPGAALNQDFLKRMTRVGMGHCQGKRCREHATMLLAREARVGLGEVLPGSYRMPVRPLSLTVMQAHEEPPGTKDQWSVWSWLHATDTRALGD